MDVVSSTVDAEVDVAVAAVSWPDDPAQAHGMAPGERRNAMGVLRSKFTVVQVQVRGGRWRDSRRTCETRVDASRKSPDDDAQWSRPHGARAAPRSGGAGCRSRVPRRVVSPTP